MTDRARSVLREALALTEDERADLAVELLASLDDRVDDPGTVQRAWTLEIERRAQREPSDRAISWPELRARVLHTLATSGRRFDA
jgi:hypothetical protein